MTTTELILRLAAAIAAGGAIGFERELRDKAAGLRTHILVSIGAATFLLLSAGYAEGHQTEELIVDPLRVVGGLIGGIGFLAAGVIIQQRGNVHGLTTAASLWMTAALGAAAGLGQFPLVGLAVAITLLVLWPIQYFEHNVLEAATKAKRARQDRNHRPSDRDEPDSADHAAEARSDEKDDEKDESD